MPTIYWRIYLGLTNDAMWQKKERGRADFLMSTHHYTQCPWKIERANWHSFFSYGLFMNKNREIII